MPTPLTLEDHEWAQTQAYQAKCLENVRISEANQLLNKELAEVRADVTREKDNEISVMAKGIEYKNKELEDLRSSLRRKDDEIASLQSRVDCLQVSERGKQDTTDRDTKDLRRQLREKKRECVSYRAVAVRDGID